MQAIDDEDGDERAGRADERPRRREDQRKRGNNDDLGQRVIGDVGAEQAVHDLDQPPRQRRQLVGAERPFAAVSERLDQIERQIGVKHRRQRGPDGEMHGEKNAERGTRLPLDQGDQSRISAPLRARMPTWPLNRVLGSSRHEPPQIHDVSTPPGGRLIEARRRFGYDAARGGLTCGVAAHMDTRLWTLESVRTANRGSAHRSGQGITGFGMVRISAIFIAVCMVLIAASLGIVVYLRFGFTGAESALAALGALIALAVYNALAARLRDRAEASAQISTLSRNSGDLARQLAEFGLRLNAMDSKVEQVLERSLATAQPLAAELEELSTLVQQLADSVAAHDLALGGAAAESSTKPAAILASASVSQPDAALAPVGQAVPAAPAAPAAAAAAVERTIAAFAGLDRDGIIGLIRSAVDAGKIDLYPAAHRDAAAA